MVPLHNVITNKSKYLRVYWAHCPYFITEETQEPERLGKLPKVTLPVSGSARARPPVSSSQDILWSRPAGLPLVSVESVWCLLLLPSSLSLGVLRGRFPWVKEIARREPTWSDGEEEGASWELQELLRTLTQVAGETVAVGPSLAKLEEKKGEESGQRAEIAQHRPASHSPQWAAHLPAELRVCWTWTSPLRLQSERGIQLCPADQTSKEKSQGNGDCGQNSRREARRKTGRSK